MQVLVIRAYNVEQNMYNNIFYVMRNVFYLTNFNLYMFFTISCRLEELVDIIIADAGGKLLSCIYFYIVVKNICLHESQICFYWFINMVS